MIQFILAMLGGFGIGMFLCFVYISVRQWKRGRALRDSLRRVTNPDHLRTRQSRRQWARGFAKGAARTALEEHRRILTERCQFTSYPNFQCELTHGHTGPHELKR